MYCPECGVDTEVIDSRHDKHGRIRRRRQCKNCAARFTTYEVSASEFEILSHFAKMVMELRLLEELYHATYGH